MMVSYGQDVDSIRVEKVKVQALDATTFTAPQFGLRDYATWPTVGMTLPGTLGRMKEYRSRV
jgi:hypothetical protein